MTTDEPPNELDHSRGGPPRGGGQHDPSVHEAVWVHDEAVSRALVLRVLVGAIVISVALCFVTYLLLRAREAQLRPGGRFPERTLGPPHEVATVLAAPYELPEQTEMAERQQERLNRYGWVDRSRRLVRIPIERAMDLVLLQGGRL